MDHTRQIIGLLQKVEQKERAMKETFRAKAYNTAIKNIVANGKPIYSIADIAGIKGIGPGIKGKIDEIIRTGTLKAVDDYENNPELKAINDLLQVHGIGPAKAKELVREHGIHSLEELEGRTDLLNDVQRMGIKYWQDFIERIPRKEMTKHDEFITKTIHDIDPKLVVEIAGSYRRKAPTSGDIDVLLTHEDDTEDYPQLFRQIIEALTEKKYVVDVFAKGTKKLMGVCRLPRHKRFRRIDILYTRKGTFPYALTYFTGSMEYNLSMRKLFLKRGLSLSEYGLKDKSGKFIEGLYTEEAILKYLGFNYIEPEERDGKVLNVELDDKDIKKLEEMKITKE